MTRLACHLLYCNAGARGQLSHFGNVNLGLNVLKSRSLLRCVNSVMLIKIMVTLTQFCSILSRIYSFELSYKFQHLYVHSPRSQTRTVGCLTSPFVYMLNPLAHAANSTVYSTGGCMHKGVHFTEFSDFFSILSTLYTQS